MKLLWEERAWDEYTEWLSEDKKTVRRINQLIRDIQRNPFDGIGKPEPLKGNLAGWWSRRIDEANRIIYAKKGLPPYVFVMLGLYAGLRREEILALKWDSVYFDGEAPYLTVRRAWHTEHNRPVISTELKTKAARRDIPLPKQLEECLKEAKKNSTSEYVE